MIRYDDALKIIQGLTLPWRSLELPLEHACGHILAQDIRALVPSPPYTNSAMDGFAVRRADALAGPLSILGSVYAKAATEDSLPNVGPMTCVKIMTGGQLPYWADTVIPVELSQIDSSGKVTFTEIPDEGTHIRRLGHDLEAHSLLLSKGTLLDPERIMVAAAFGHRVLSVRERPRLAFISTGDELVEPGEALPQGAVYNSSKYFLLASASALGLRDTPHITIPDDEVGAV